MVTSRKDAPQASRKSFWNYFYTFISMGGLVLLVVILGVAAILIGMALKT